MAGFQAPTRGRFSAPHDTGWLNRQQQDIVDYLREENRVLREHLKGKRIRFTDAQRRRLAAKGKALGRKVLADVCTLVTPETVLRWYGRLIARKYDGSANRGSGRPPVAESIQELVVRFARQNASWGYGRIQGALKNLDHTVSRSTIARILKAHGIEPAPQRHKGMRDVAGELEDWMRADKKRWMVSHDKRIADAREAARAWGEPIPRDASELTPVIDAAAAAAVLGVMVKVCPEYFEFGKRKRANHLLLTDRARRELDKSHREMAKPFLMPMLYPPRDWQVDPRGNGYEGGYLQTGDLRLISSRSFRKHTRDLRHPRRGGDSEGGQRRPGDEMAGQPSRRRYPPAGCRRRAS